MYNKLIKVLSKEVVESLIRNTRKLIVKKENKHRDTLSSLKNTGICAIPNFIEKKECTTIINEIDALIDSENTNIWRDSEGADTRIFFADELSLNIKKFYEDRFIRQVLAEYTGTVEPNGMVLAARIEYKEGNAGSGGGWHRDSPVTHQFKAICYLNAVNSKNGPFQYIKSSHQKVNIIRAYLKKIFTPAQYRFNEGEITNFLKKQSKSIFTQEGDAGDLILVDTKGIHRGKPLIEGYRYALFCYFWHGPIPPHFTNLKQTIKNEDA